MPDKQQYKSSQGAQKSKQQVGPAMVFPQYLVKEFHKCSFTSISGKAVSLSEVSTSPAFTFCTFLPDQMVCFEGILFVHVTEAFICQQEIEGLDQRTDDGYPLLLSKGKDPCFAMEVRFHSQSFGEFHRFSGR
jgi:hypothetical protein